MNHTENKVKSHLSNLTLENPLMHRFRKNFEKSQEFLNVDTLHKFWKNLIENFLSRHTFLEILKTKHKIS